MPRPPDRHSYALYNACFVPVGLAAYHLARFVSPKARRGLEGRVGLWDRLAARREDLEGAVWFHAASVGEYEQARPVLRAFKEECERRGEHIPTLQTVFSPSGYDFARDRCDADVIDYLPLDTAGAMSRMIQTIRPRAVVFMKFDCWPNLIWAARRREVPVLLLDATLHRRSRRLRPPARTFFRRLFDCFDAIGAISPGDADRFRSELGSSTPIEVTGDTRTDQVVHRWEAAANGPLATALEGTSFDYFALGSIWPADEDLILTAALKEGLAEDRRGLVLVPHEPTPDTLDRLQRRCREFGVSPTLLSELFDSQTQNLRISPLDQPDRWRFVLVDCVGLLAEIYRGVSFAYVGGSCSTGVHNVLEPAVCGQPVLFGPRIHNAYEAERLVEIGAGFVLTHPEEARVRVAEFFAEPHRRRECGRRAQDFVLHQRGATQASLELLLAHLAPPLSPRPADP